MDTPPRLTWPAEALWETLAPLVPGLSVEVVASLPSTNTCLLDRARAGGDHAVVRRSVESTAFARREPDWQPCLLVAEQQTAGRGRLGRDWHAEPAASLTFSLALPLAPADWSGLSLAVGAALADALDPLDGGQAPRIGLKWPNDLWLLDPAGSSGTGTGGRKLGGILIETVAAGPRRLAVIGIGLNVSPLATVNDTQLTHGLASLQELAPGLDAPTALWRVAEPLVRAVRRFESDGFAAHRAAFERRDLLAGRAVHTTQADVPHGTARGVADDGSLWVDTPTGRQRLHSGEVSVRLEATSKGTSC